MGFSCYGVGGFNPLPSDLTYEPAPVPNWCGLCSPTFMSAYRSLSSSSCFAPLYNAAVIASRGGLPNPTAHDDANFNAMTQLVLLRFMPDSVQGAFACGADCDGASPCKEQRIQRADLLAWVGDYDANNRKLPERPSGPTVGARGGPGHLPSESARQLDIIPQPLPLPGQDPTIRKADNTCRYVRAGRRRLLLSTEALTN